MKVKETLRYMLNVPEDYSTRDISIFLSYLFNIEDDIEDVDRQLERELSISLENLLTK